MVEVDLQARMQDYLQAFESRDLDQCVDHYSEDAILNFQNSVYSGKASITEWHRERFDADLRLIRLENLYREGDTITLEGVATSKRLRAWKIDSISGVMTARFSGEKIQELSFGVRFGLW